MSRVPAGPLGIRLSEWKLASLRRLLTRVLASPKLPHQPGTLEAAAGAASGSAKSSSGPQACDDPQDLDGPHAHAAVITVQNACGMALQFGQVGTDECITIADGSTVPYR